MALHLVFLYLIAIYWKPTIWDDLNDTVPLHFSICAMIFYVYACVYKIWVFLWTIWHIFSTWSRGQHRHLGSGTNMSSSTHRFGYHRSSGVAAEGGGISEGLSLHVSIDWKPESMTYAWRSVQNEKLFHMCHTSILDVLKVLLHILEPDPLPSKRDIIKSIDDFRRMCSIFHSPALQKNMIQTWEVIPYPQTWKAPPKLSCIKKMIKDGHKRIGLLFSTLIYRFYSFAQSQGLSKESSPMFALLNASAPPRSTMWGLSSFLDQRTVARGGRGLAWRQGDFGARWRLLEMLCSETMMK